MRQQHSALLQDQHARSFVATPPLIPPAHGPVAGHVAPIAANPLANLLDRHELEEWLSATLQGIRGTRRLAIACIDLRLKTITERDGHDAADAVLAETVTRLSKRLRPGDRLAQLAWDELVMVLPRVHDAWAWRPFVAALRRAVERPVKTSLAPVSVSVGIGVHIVEVNSDVRPQAEDAIRAAALDMYRSSRGRAEWLGIFL